MEDNQYVLQLKEEDGQIWEATIWASSKMEAARKLLLEHPVHLQGMTAAELVPSIFIIPFFIPRI